MDDKRILFGPFADKGFNNFLKRSLEADGILPLNSTEDDLDKLIARLEAEPCPYCGRGGKDDPDVRSIQDQT